MAVRQQQYDLVVIGGGPAGYVAAIRAGQLGMNVALVESCEVGGTCLHSGCIPTKALLETAELLERAKQSRQFGLVGGSSSLDLAAALDRKQEIVRKLHLGVKSLLSRQKVTMLHGTGLIRSPGRVEVCTAEQGDRQIAGRNILVATGSRPRSLNQVPFEGKSVLSSTDALQLEQVPGSIAVVGAGPVGVEFASLFRSFGAQVTLMEVMPRVLPGVDAEASSALERALTRRGIKILTGAQVLSMRQDLPDCLRLSVSRNGKASEEVTAEKILVSVGRDPCTEAVSSPGLDLVGEGGFIEVDERMQTREPGIYAAGDVVRSPQLAHVASAEGILAVERMAGFDWPPIDYDAVPSCVHSIPEVATVGLSEERAKERGHDTKVGRFPFRASGRAAVLGEQEGFVKLVADSRTERILGIHIVGPRASELAGEAALAVGHGLTCRELSLAIHPHPTLSEALGEAARAALGGAIHF